MRVLEQARLYRKIEVTTATDRYVIEYHGWGLGCEWVAIDGVQLSPVHWNYWPASRWEIFLGPHRCILKVVACPWHRLQAIELRMDDAIIYEERDGRGSTHSP